MTPPVALVLYLALFFLAGGTAFRVRVWWDSRPPRTVGRHHAPPGRSTVRISRGKFRWDASVTPRGAR